MAAKHETQPEPAMSTAASAKIETVDVERKGSPPAVPAASAAHGHQAVGNAQMNAPARPAIMIAVSHLVLLFDVSEIYLSYIESKAVCASGPRDII